MDCKLPASSPAERLEISLDGGHGAPPSDGAGGHEPPAVFVAADLLGRRVLSGASRLEQSDAKHFIHVYEDLLSLREGCKYLEPKSARSLLLCRCLVREAMMLLGLLHLEEDRATALVYVRWCEEAIAKAQRLAADSKPGLSDRIRRIAALLMHILGFSPDHDPGPTPTPIQEELKIIRTVADAVYSDILAAMRQEGDTSFVRGASVHRREGMLVCVVGEGMSGQCRRLAEAIVRGASVHRREEAVVWMVGTGKRESYVEFLQGMLNEAWAKDRVVLVGRLTASRGQLASGLCREAFGLLAEAQQVACCSELFERAVAGQRQPARIVALPVESQRWRGRVLSAARTLRELMGAPVDLVPAQHLFTAALSHATLESARNLGKHYRDRHGGCDAFVEGRGARVHESLRGSEAKHNGGLFLNAQTFFHRIDTKSRLTIPSMLREKLVGEQLGTCEPSAPGLRGGYLIIVDRHLRLNTKLLTMLSMAYERTAGRQASASESTAPGPWGGYGAIVDGLLTNFPIACWKAGLVSGSLGMEPQVQKVEAWLAEAHTQHRWLISETSLQGNRRLLAVTLPQRRQNPGAGVGRRVGESPDLVWHASGRRASLETASRPGGPRQIPLWARHETQPPRTPSSGQWALLFRRLCRDTEAPRGTSTMKYVLHRKGYRPQLFFRKAGLRWLWPSKPLGSVGPRAMARNVMCKDVTKSGLREIGVRKQ